MVAETGNINHSLLVLLFLLALRLAPGLDVASGGVYELIAMTLLHAVE